MIAFIEGTIQGIDDDGIVVMVGGIGYLLNVPERVLERLRVGDAVAFHTHQHIREDALDLYGFSERSDLRFFRQLIQVSGVGPRLALAVLSQLETSTTKRAIIHGDVSVLTSITGVGKKTAERIVFDLKESIGIDTVSTAAATDVGNTALSAMDALLSLGYEKVEALTALQGVDGDLPAEEQVRAALKNLGPSR